MSHRDPERTRCHLHRHRDYIMERYPNILNLGVFRELSQ